MNRIKTIFFFVAVLTLAFFGTTHAQVFRFGVSGYGMNMSGDFTKSEFTNNSARM